MYCRMLPLDAFNLDEAILGLGKPILVIFLSGRLRQVLLWLNMFKLILEGNGKVELVIYESRREKTCLTGFSNNKGADQPAHPCNLFSAFVTRLVGSIMKTCSKRNINFLASL